MSSRSTRLKSREATGVIYFTFATTGLAMSVGLAVLIIGIPFFLLFIGATRGISLVEGRMVEGLLGTRMPRRPLFPDRQRPLLDRILEMLKDPRTWKIARAPPSMRSNSASIE